MILFYLALGLCAAVLSVIAIGFYRKFSGEYNYKRYYRRPCRR